MAKEKKVKADSAPKEPAKPRGPAINKKFVQFIAQIGGSEDAAELEALYGNVMVRGKEGAEKVMKFSNKNNVINRMLRPEVKDALDAELILNNITSAEFQANIDYLKKTTSKRKPKADKSASE